MMRGAQIYDCGRSNPKGEIILHTEPLPARIYSSFITKVPFMRGMVLLWTLLVLGMRTLLFSAQIL